MTPVSRKRLEKQIEKMLDNLLTKAFAKQVSPSDSLKFINIILTPTEVSMIKKRIGIILLLNEGLDFISISKITKTTRQTVARIRLQLAVADPKDKKYVSEILRGIKLYQDIKNVLNALMNIDISRSTFRKKISSI